MSAKVMVMVRKLRVNNTKLYSNFIQVTSQKQQTFHTSVTTYRFIKHMMTLTQLVFDSPNTAWQMTLVPSLHANTLSTELSLFVYFILLYHHHYKDSDLT